MLGTVLVAPTAAGVRFDTVQWGDTQRRAVAEPTLVRRVFLCTMYDALMKRVCVRNNVRWMSVRTIRYDVPCVRSRECRYVRYNTWR